MIKYTIIVPTFNGSKRIMIALRALLRQTIRPEEMEIIIIDDGSTDETTEVIRSFEKTYPDRNIVYIRKENGGPASARNVGIKHARGEILFFTDDDCEPPALWMEKILTIYKRYPEVVGVGGWYTPPLHELRTNCYHQFFYLLCRFDFGWGLDFFQGKTGEYSPLPAINNSNISFYKWVFEKVGGFDARFRRPNLEDLEFSERVQNQNFPLYYLQLHILHHKKINWKRFIKDCIARAKEFRVYQEKTGKKHIAPLNIWKRFIRFKMVYDKAKKKDYGFRFRRKILFLALAWFFLLKFFTRTLFLYSR